MCGRFTNEADPRKLIARFQAANRNFKFTPNTNIAPTTFAPTVVMEGGKRVLKNMKWGLIPSWAKDEKIGVKCFNARGETVHERPAFRSSFKSRRCLVPATGFYEWQKSVKHKRKIPHRITVKGEGVFAFAGLWSRWEPKGGDPLETFTIITTDANQTLKPIHERMPVILHRDQEQVWVNPEMHNLVVLKSLLVPYEADEVEVEPLEEVPLSLFG